MDVRSWEGKARKGGGGSGSGGGGGGGGGGGDGIFKLEIYF
jgi:hypothetical protein